MKFGGRLLAAVYYYPVSRKLMRSVPFTVESNCVGLCAPMAGMTTKQALQDMPKPARLRIATACHFRFLSAHGQKAVPNAEVTFDRLFHRPCPYRPRFALTHWQEALDGIKALPELLEIPTGYDVRALIRNMPFCGWRGVLETDP